MCIRTQNNSKFISLLLTWMLALLLEFRSYSSLLRCKGWTNGTNVEILSWFLLPLISMVSEAFKLLGDLWIDDKEEAGRFNCRVKSKLIWPVDTGPFSLLEFGMEDNAGDGNCGPRIHKCWRSRGNLKNNAFLLFSKQCKPWKASLHNTKTN